MENNNREIFENLKKFFASDMKMKENLLNISPKEIDDYNEESRIEYTDKIYKKLREYEIEFEKIVENFGLGLEINEAIKANFSKIREKFLIGKYNEGVIQKLYKTQFSNMSKNLVEEVKSNCVGYTFSREKLAELINKSTSINELLHVMHSYITNDEEILQAMPVVDAKSQDIEPITLYGEETEFSRKLFDDFPIESKCGITDIISMDNKILMMIRDVGHALSIDIDTSKEDDIIVKYFVPKLCNRDMIEVLPGINKSSITPNGASGIFKTSKEEMSQVLIDFIEKVPTEMDMPMHNYNMDKQEEGASYEIKEEALEQLFRVEDAKEIAMESNENGRRTGTLVYLQTKLKEAKDKKIGRITRGKLENRGDSEDGTSRDQ